MLHICFSVFSSCRLLRARDANSRSDNSVTPPLLVRLLFRAPREGNPCRSPESACRGSRRRIWLLCFTPPSLEKPFQQASLTAW